MERYVAFVSLLLLAYVLPDGMHMPYASMPAQGETNSIFSIYFALIVTFISLTAVFPVMYKAVGGAFAQLLLLMFYLFVETWVTHRRYFKGHAAVWLSKDVGVSLVISALAGLAGYATIPAVQGSELLAILTGMLLWLTATLRASVSRSSRLIFIGFWNYLRNR